MFGPVNWYTIYAWFKIGLYPCDKFSSKLLIFYYFGVPDVTAGIHILNWNSEVFVSKVPEMVGNQDIFSFYISLKVTFMRRAVLMAMK